MFQVKYFMDMNRYRQWTCPAPHKTKGFWFWLALLVISTPLMFYFRAIDSDLRLQSMSAMCMLIAVYRGFLFRPMYANKQFKVMCVNYHKEERDGWDSGVKVEEDGVETFMDDESRGCVTWDQVQSMTVTSGYADLNVATDFIRLPKDCFTKGSLEEFLAWMDQNHPEIERKRETKEFDN